MGNRVGRKRKHNLPPNLYQSRRAGGTIYYTYRNPQTGKLTGFGADRSQAVAAAITLNATLGTGGDLVARAMGTPQDQTLEDYAEHFRDVILPSRRINGKPLSTAYLQETRRILARCVEGMGPERPLGGITQAEIADYLNRLPSAEAFNQHRVRLVQLWAHAVSEGRVPHNLPERILPRDKEARRRGRLDLDGYRAIYPLAEPAIQVAMELSLNALQRRSDIQKWRFDDQRDGHAYIVQSKTHKHGPSAFLRIPLALPVAFSARGAHTLGDLIDSARDDVLCPYLVHARPQRIRKSTEKDHPFQLTKKAISDGFAAARDASGLFTGMPADSRPSFHELLSLGEHLRLKQGWTVAQIQQLRGHTSERMTRHYLDGHEWTTVDVPGIKKAR